MIDLFGFFRGLKKRKIEHKEHSQLRYFLISKPLTYLHSIRPLKIIKGEETESSMFP